MRSAALCLVVLAACSKAPVGAAPPPAAQAPASAPPVVAPAAAAKDAPPAVPVPPSDDLRLGSRPWVDFEGTAIVGFGVLRLVPDAGKTARFDLKYEEKPGDYGPGAGSEYQFFVLPGDAFAAKTSAYADEFLAFARTHGSFDGKAYALRVSVTAKTETTVLVCYGPWTAPDSGRPAGDRPVFRVDVAPKDGAFEWIESEAGELITNNWTNRPGVRRGGPWKRDSVWTEVRPMILYDARLVRAPDEPPLASPSFDFGDGNDPRDALDRREQRDDAVAAAARADHRLVMAPELVEKFRRVPIRWR